MLLQEIIDAYSDVKPINTICVQNAELLVLKQVVLLVTYD
jgi:hypothetical protein